MLLRREVLPADPGQRSPPRGAYNLYTLTPADRESAAMTDVLFGQSYYLKFDPKLYKAMQPYPPLGTLYAAAVVFHHPSDFRHDRYGWYISRGPEARSVTSRLDPETVRAAIERLVELACLAPSIHNTQPWRFSVGEDTIGIFAGWITAINLLDMSTQEFIRGLRLFFEPFDITYSLIKTTSFGLLITVVGCFQGFTTEGGAEGVGVSTTRAVVISSMLILLFDAFWAVVLLQ